MLESFSKMLALNKDAQVKQRQPIILFLVQKNSFITQN